MKTKTTFALYFANRGFMPAELIEGARDDMMKAVTDAGYDYLIMDKNATRYGAVETRDEGMLYAKWLKEHKGQFQGVICCMPIFADENGAITARGSAIAAGIALGTFKDVNEACKTMVKKVSEIVPNEENHRKYMETYAKYKKLYSSLKEVF